MISANAAQPSAAQCPQCGASLPPTTEGYTVCQHCGSSLVWSHRAAGETVVRGMRLRQLTCTDTQGTGLEIFRLLAPVGWQFQGGCQWLLDNPGMPAVVSFQVANPQGAEAFEVLPNTNLFWNNNPMTRVMFPTGSRYFGAEVRPPMGIQEALRGIVLPRYRSRVQNLQIVSVELQPDLPRLVRSEAAVSGGSAEGGKVRLRYTAQGRQIEEEIYGLVEVFRSPAASLFGAAETITWFIDSLVAFRAAAGLLDATADLYKVMSGSFRLNPHWYAAFKSIAVYLCQLQIQRIRHIGQIGEIYARTGREIREQNLNDWYARQAVYDRLNTDWSRAIRGVDGFYDPHRQEVVDLPAGYGHAWANNLGEYIVTESADFNPNVGSNLHWEPMAQQ